MKEIQLIKSHCGIKEDTLPSEHSNKSLVQVESTNLIVKEEPKNL